MDKSYRIKMENRLSDNILTIEYVLNCVAKYEKKINELGSQNINKCLLEILKKM